MVIQTLRPCIQRRRPSIKSADNSITAADRSLETEACSAANAGTCSALVTALGDAQTLLTQLSFDGTGSYKGKLDAAQQSLANSLNSTLTAYNEGTLGGGCPTSK